MKRIAWATQHQSNGFVSRWSRWHYTINDPVITVCGKRIPHTKLVEDNDKHQGDFRIKGGMCKECFESTEK